MPKLFPILLQRHNHAVCHSPKLQGGGYQDLRTDIPDLLNTDASLSCMLPFQARSLNVLCSPILSCTPARISMRRMHVRQYYQERASNPRTTGHFRASTRLRSQRVECCRSGTLLGCVMHDPYRSRSSGIADGSLTARQRMTRMMTMGIVSARTCLLTVLSATVEPAGLSAGPQRSAALGVITLLRMPRPFLSGKRLVAHAGATSSSNHYYIFG